MFKDSEGVSYGLELSPEELEQLNEAETPVLWVRQQMTRTGEISPTFLTTDKQDVVPNWPQVLVLCGEHQHLMEEANNLVKDRQHTRFSGSDLHPRLFLLKQTTGVIVDRVGAFTSDIFGFVKANRAPGRLIILCTDLPPSKVPTDLKFETLKI